MNVKTLTEQILEKMSSIKSWQFKFMSNLFSLLLAMRGRYNFCNMARWGSTVESTFRDNYAKAFAWLEFNRLLVEQYLSDDLAIAFDPSFVPKSGKHTPGLGYFYSGCAGRELRGLELSGIAVIDQYDKTALHLEAVQTVGLQENENLLSFYARTLTSRREQLQQISSLLLVDAYFAKQTFVDAMLEAGFTVITRLRKDARLRYLYSAGQRSGRGRPRKYDGRIDPYELREDQVRQCAQADDDSWKAYELLANVQAWKRNVKLIVVQELNQDGTVRTARLIACTDIHKDGGEVLFAYHSRFQIEILYRDAKQHLGLTHCQARSEEKIHFHLNASLTAVSLAKTAHQLEEGKQDQAFSLADIKTLYANELLLERFITTFGIDPNMSKIKSLRDAVTNLGRMAA
ncbi:MAG: transposase [Cyanobacteria bacterium P01_F01_bin.86]